MQKIDCNQYPLIGKLIAQAVQSDKKIHRSILMSTQHGRITIYHTDQTFILECDTNGDHDPNSYYFFNEIERNEIYIILSEMSILLDEKLSDAQIKTLTDQTLSFFQNSMNDL